MAASASRFVEMNDWGDWVVVAPISNLSGQASSEFIHALETLASSEKSNFRFDFRFVEELDSLSLWAFVSFVRSKRPNIEDGIIEIVNMNPHFQTLLKSIRIDESPHVILHPKEAVNGG